MNVLIFYFERKSTFKGCDSNCKVNNEKQVTEINVHTKNVVLIFFPVRTLLKSLISNFQLWL